MSNKSSENKNQPIIHFKFKNQQTNGLYQLNLDHLDEAFLNKHENIQTYEFLKKPIDYLKEEVNHFSFSHLSKNKNLKTTMDPIDSELLNQLILKIKNNNELLGCEKSNLYLNNNNYTADISKECNKEINDGMLYLNKILKSFLYLIYRLLF